MFETEFYTEINGNTIAGTICLPNRDGRFPMVLLIHGSGPLDRNGNTKGFKSNIFNAIAHHLANYGIGSLRYDKRGCGQSTGDYHSASHTDLVKDAEGLVDYLTSSDFSDRNHIYLLGHSEGTIIVPRLSSTKRNIAGGILLCPCTQPLEHYLREQAKHSVLDIQKAPGLKGTLMRLSLRLPWNSLAAHWEFLDKLKHSTTPTIKHRSKVFNAKWYRELFELDIEKVFRQVTCPLLVIGGGKDIQCSPVDVERVKQLSTHHVEAYIIQNMTHILRCDEEEASFLNYKRLIKKGVEEQVLRLTQQWLETCIIESSANQNMESIATTPVESGNV